MDFTQLSAFVTSKSDVSRAFNNSLPLTGRGVSLRCQWVVVRNCRSQDTASWRPAQCPAPWMIVIAVFVKSKHPDMTRPPNVTANHQLHLNLCFDQGDRFLGSCPLIPRQTPFDWLVMGFFVGGGPPVVISVIKLPRKSIVNWKLTFLNGDPCRPLFTPSIPTLDPYCPI